MSTVLYCILNLIYKTDTGSGKIYLDHGLVVLLDGIVLTRDIYTSM